MTADILFINCLAFFHKFMNSVTHFEYYQELLKLIYIFPALNVWQINELTA